MNTLNTTIDNAVRTIENEARRLNPARRAVMLRGVLGTCTKAAKGMKTPVAKCARSLRRKMAGVQMISVKEAYGFADALKEAQQEAAPAKKTTQDTKALVRATARKEIAEASKFVQVVQAAQLVIMAGGTPAQVMKVSEDVISFLDYAKFSFVDDDEMITDVLDAMAAIEDAEYGAVEMAHAAMDALEDAAKKAVKGAVWRLNQAM